MLLTIILFVVILGLLVFVHELGHFMAARRMGMAVDEFGFGFPPRAFGLYKNAVGTWKIVFRKTPESDQPRSTIYSINWFPLGGFVRIKGEQGDKKNEADSFSFHKPWRRAVVLMAGVSMNVIFAFVLISIGAGIGLPGVVDESLPSYARVSNDQLQIVQVNDDTPAAQAGLQAGDTVLSIDDQEVASVSAFQEYTQPRLGKEMTITVRRGDEVTTHPVTPEALYEEGKGAIGTALAETAFITYPWYIAPWIGLQTTISLLWQIIATFGIIIAGLFTGQSAGVDVAGPIGVAALTGQVAQLGFIYVLQFAAILSINLAIINAIPFPALDGGRLLFVIIEKIRGKVIQHRTETLIHNLGFMLLMLLVVFVTFKDLNRFTSIFEKIGNIF
ncbi:MAG: RIP metalloprotease RseP [Candidatus Kerfeldbacteria bacterium]|nr:RIP metalloprotease RseP [Candidatus Kerfeldbacteria bacterium]